MLLKDLMSLTHVYTEDVIRSVNMKKSNNAPPASSSIIEGYVSSLSNAEKEREQTDRSIQMLEHAIKQASSISVVREPVFSVPARPEMPKQYGRKRCMGRLGRN